MQDRRQDLIARHIKRPGIKGKVIAKCIECIFDDIGGNGTWRQQVEACTATACPLWSVRPISKPREDLT